MFIRHAVFLFSRIKIVEFFLATSFSILSILFHFYSCNPTSERLVRKWKILKVKGSYIKFLEQIYFDCFSTLKPKLVQNSQLIIIDFQATISCHWSEPISIFSGNSSFKMSKLFIEFLPFHLTFWSSIFWINIH